MPHTASKPWASLLTTSGIAFLSAMSTTPASAFPPCESGILISAIVTPPSTGYTCEIGGIGYTFNDSISELNSSPTAALNFINTPTFQKLEFINLSNQGTTIGFNYTIYAISESVLAIEQSYEADPMSPPPLFPPFGITGVTTAPGLPFLPSPNPRTVEASFEPDTSGNPPFATLTSLTHTIQKTPAPLPMVGAGLAFAFSRKLRRRIHRAS